MSETVQSHPPPEVTNLFPIRMTSTVVRGFGRGSKDLGIPTANLDCSESVLKIHTTRVQRSSSSDNIITIDDLPCGIYWGFARIGEHGPTMKCAASIGYNPTYSNTVKTVEPHLIASSTNPRRHASSCQETLLSDFYGQVCRLSVVGYLRPELPFEGLEKLVFAIKQDISNTERLADNDDDPSIRTEKEWVDSNEPLI